MLQLLSRPPHHAGTYTPVLVNMLARWGRICRPIFTAYFSILLRKKPPKTLTEDANRWERAWLVVRDKQFCIPPVSLFFPLYFSLSLLLAHEQILRKKHEKRMMCSDSFLNRIQAKDFSHKSSRDSWQEEGGMRMRRGKGNILDASHHPGATKNRH